jgi:hypothetical protein
MPNKKIDPGIKSLLRYRDRVIEDPLRLSILAAHALIEEMIELAIAEAVPNSECFEVPKMQFRRKFEIIQALEPADRDGKTYWKCIEKLTNLRNAAAHRDYETLREERFRDLAEFFYPDPDFRVGLGRETILEEVTETCAGYLLGMQRSFRSHRQRP